MASRVVCPGSYDPVTVGHLDVIARAAALFDEVVVVVMHNPAKSGTFPAAERVAFIDDATASLPGVRVLAATPSSSWTSAVTWRPRRSSRVCAAPVTTTTRSRWPR